MIGAFCGDGWAFQLRGMLSHARSSIILLSIASFSLAPAAAQDGVRQRTGPDAIAVPLPPFPDPAELPPQAPSQPPPAPPRAPLAGFRVNDVRIIAEEGGPDRAPYRGWMPPQETISGLTLDYRPGQALDGAWVLKQFERNGIVGGDGSVDRALALVQLINRAFLSAGFINSGLVVPPQNRTGAGPLELRLILGQLVGVGTAPPVTVEFAGDSAQGLSANYVRRRIPSAEARPISGVEIERDFRLLADDPAIRTVNADLRPGTRPGEASLHLIVVPQSRFDAYLTAANSRSPSVGGERVAAGASIRNLLSGGDMLSGEAGMTKGLNDYVLSYTTPFIRPRLTLSLRGSVNNAAVVAAALVPLGIRSRDRAGEVGVTYRLLQRPLTPLASGGGFTPARTLSVGALLAHRRSRSFLLGDPFSFSPGSVNGRTEYTAVRLTGDYLQRSVREVFAVSITGTLGLDGTRANQPGVFTPKRNFKSLLVQLNYARRLSKQGLEARARLTGQISDSILYSGERLSAGGEASVRGYRENFLLADRGVVGSLELSHPLRLSGRERKPSGVDFGAFALSGFFDAALVRNHRAPEPVLKSISSLGLAANWTPSDAIVARVAYGVALKGIDQVGGRDLQDRGLHFRFTLFPLRLFRR